MAAARSERASRSSQSTTSRVDAVLPYVSPQVSTIIQVQRLTGVRPCKLVITRPCDIDMSADVWVYGPYDHKNKWRGHDREIPRGPEAQALLRPFLNREPAVYMFSPREAAHKLACLAGKRRDPVPGQIGTGVTHPPRRGAIRPIFPIFDRTQPIGNWAGLRSLRPEISAQGYYSKHSV